MSVKTHFSIRDIENLSGVKAHTICVCEKKNILFGYWDKNTMKYKNKTQHQTLFVLIA